MIEITAEAKALIDTIIEKQEGGWKLTENKNDPDGGWTYAGVTAKVFSEVAYRDGTQKYEGPMPVSAIKNDLEEGKEEFIREFVYAIYFNNYYSKLQLDKLPANLRGPLFSAAVNCGVETAVIILQSTINKYLNFNDKLKLDGVIGDFTVNKASYLHVNVYFLREWMRHYINLVQANAKAWQEFAINMQDELADEAVNASDKKIETLVNNKPTVLRSAMLEGWFDRVEFWR